VAARRLHAVAPGALPLVTPAPISLYAVLRALRQRTDAVLVGFSGGKDSVATLDLCVREFAKVEAYFFYLVPELRFQQTYLARIAKHYRITIHQRPHWLLSWMLRAGEYRPRTLVSDNCAILDATGCEHALCHDTGIDWIATGERAGESLQRRGMLSACGGLDDKRKRAYPIAFWPVEAVRRYNRKHHLPVSPDAAVLPRSFGDLQAPTLIALRDHWPDDFERIKRLFPHVEAAIAREQFFGGRRARREHASALHDQDGEAVGADGGAVQPAQD
jgi:phosphoadenosine phosphosulfate reductase